MPTSINRAKSVVHRGKGWSLRPQVTGATALLIVTGAFVACVLMLPRDFVLPAISMLFFILATAAALVAARHPADDETELTHYDIAGILTFIGICVASQIDPDQLVRLVEGANRKP